MSFRWMTMITPSKFIPLSLNHLSLKFHLLRLEGTPLSLLGITARRQQDLSFLLDFSHYTTQPILLTKLLTLPLSAPHNSYFCSSNMHAQMNVTSPANHRNPFLSVPVSHLSSPAQDTSHSWTAGTLVPAK